jgi:N-acyl-D-amino-acid deacylase
MTMDVDVLIRGGRVYDGAGGEPFVGDVGIAGGRIALIVKGGGRFTGKAEKVVDAKDLSVSPGFIDTHGHSEFTLLADGRAEGKILQGVTTEINGNCGLSAAPLYGEALERREEDIRELGIKERWSTFAEYFALLERSGSALNFAALTGHGNIRASVIGYADRDPDNSEMQRMQALLKDAVGQGAIGLSTGLIYPPGVYGKTGEIIELARCIKDLIYASHMRSESDRLIEAIEEAVSIGRNSGIAVHISHLKTAGRHNWAKIDKAVSLIEASRAEGLRVTCDRYPYTAASTDLDAVLPAWTYEGGAGEELKRLSNPGTRSLIKGQVILQRPDEEDWNSIVVSSMNSDANRWMEGKTIAFLSERAGKQPVEFLLDILFEEKLRIGAIFHSMNEDNLRRFLALPYLMTGTDSSVRCMDGPTHRGKPHPRGFGTFARFVGRYARDLGLMSMGEAIRRITLLPSETFGLIGRGRLKEGFHADVVVFDEARVIDKASFEEPFLRPEGIHSVFVNGTLVASEGVSTGKRPGRVLRNGR